MYRIQLKMHGGKWQTAMMFEDADSLRRAYRSFVIIMGGWCVRIQKQVGPKSWILWTSCVLASIRTPKSMSSSGIVGPLTVPIVEGSQP
jgi:hypothetical protein